jgi:hypothetical protein
LKRSVIFVQADDDQVRHRQHPRPRRSQGQPQDGSRQSSVPTRQVRQIKNILFICFLFRIYNTAVFSKHFLSFILFLIFCPVFFSFTALFELFSLLHTVQNPVVCSSYFESN